MPFYKWILASSTESFISKQETETAFFSEESFNRDLVGALRGLSRLLSIADDVFNSVENDCRVVQARTENLKSKIDSCQNIINDLNAKSVVVPVSSLTHSCYPAADGSFKSDQLLELGLLTAHKRPDCVGRLYGVAHGPSPSVYIYPQQSLFADCSFSSADGGTYSEPSCSIDQSGYPIDAYYNDLRSSSSCDSRSSISCKSFSDVESQRTEPSQTIHSTLVPIDISGQTFHRMATLRRSLIHMDFLIRKKKKKDKRRNTVADIESSVLNAAIEPINNGKRLSVTESEGSNDSSRIINSRSEVTIAEINEQSIAVCSSSEENNNSKSFLNTSKTQKSESKDKISSNGSFRKTGKDTCIKPKCRQEDNQIYNEPTKQSAEWARRIKESVETKKKSRTHIPISTVSAAMTVAVKMRQTSGVTNSEDAQSSSGNWSGSGSSGRASSDSDDIKACLKDKASSSKDSLLSESPSSSFDLRKFKDFERIESDNKQSEHLTAPIANRANSFSSGIKYSFPKQDKNHSLDSDDDLSTTSYIGYNSRYTSSTSISTGSNESLNSLLSRTATELSGSTETLTSESKLPLPPPPPPPPPPRISSAKANPAEQLNKSVDLYSRTYPSYGKPRKQENLPNKGNLVMKSMLKTTDSKKSSGEDSKSTRVTFSNLLHKKFKSKENHNKSKQHSPTKTPKVSNSRGIDMYGGQSSSGHKVTVLVNGNKLPSPEKPKVEMRSFLPKKRIMYKEVYGLNGYLDPNDNSSLYSSSCASLRTDCISPTNSEVLSDSAVESSDEMNIPLKYAPQITVMPQRRQSDPYQSSIITCCCRSYDGNFPCTHGTQQNTRNNNEQKHYNHQEAEYYPQPQNYVSQVPGIYSAPRNVCTAHVVLDSNGHVIHSTSSLDRRLYKKIQPQVGMESSTSPNRGVQRVGYNYPEQRSCNRNPSFTQSNHQKISPTKPCSNLQFLNTTCQNNFQISFKKEDNLKTQHYSQTGDHVSPQERNKIKQQNNVHFGSLPSHSKVNNKSHQEGNIYQPPYTNFTNSTSNANSWRVCSTNNTAYSPVGQSLLTQENVNQHAREMDKSLHTSTARCTINRTPLSEGYYDNRSPPDLIKSNSDHFQADKTTKSMTAEDLFAIIHDSKKRLNIKTESDISPTPSSSRSSSPSFLRQVSTSKNGLAETGFLSPRGSYALTSRDRRSWADFRPAPERKSLASDRMGPNKPTSLHEFKMLLLQARSSTPGNQRKSAVEQLKATSPSNSVDLSESTLPNSPVSSPLSPLQSSMTYGIYDGHLTVPLKRSHRSRGLVQPRYIMYPPILEDCSEETENSSETTPNNIPKCQTPKNGANHDENWRVNKHVTFETGNEPQSRASFTNSSMWV